MQSMYGPETSYTEFDANVPMQKWPTTGKGESKIKHVVVSK